MNSIKKILVTSILSLVLAVVSSQEAKASGITSETTGTGTYEQVKPEDGTLPPATENPTDIGTVQALPSDLPDTPGEDREGTEALPAGTTSPEAAETSPEAADALPEGTEVLPGAADTLPEGTDTLQEVEGQLPEELPEVPEGYEIYVDEQGQVILIEKEPEEEVKEQKDEASYSEKDLRLLAGLIYAEAGNQSYEGMLAVANVVLNRVKSDAYYHVDTIKEVIYDNKWSVQFSVTIKSSKSGKSLLDRALEYYDTGKFGGSNPEAEKKAMDRAIRAAKAALQGENNIGDYLCFRAYNKSASRIKEKYPDYRIIDDHIFYRTK